MSEIRRQPLQEAYEKAMGRVAYLANRVDVLELELAASKAREMDLHAECQRYLEIILDMRP